MKTMPHSCNHLTLWYTQPAQKWVEALPVGNGRLGAMVFGGTAVEHLQFNEDTLWTGRPHPYHNKGPSGHLSAVRTKTIDPDQLSLTAKVRRDVMQFGCRLLVRIEAGSIRGASDHIDGCDTDAVTLILTAATNHRAHRRVDADPAARRGAIASFGVSGEKHLKRFERPM